MLHTNFHILYIYFIKMNLNLKEFQESIKYNKSYQENKIEFLDELYFNSNLHSNLNIKPEFQENLQFSTSLSYSCMNVIKFFSTSHHVATVLIMKNELHHVSQMQTLMKTLKMNGTTMRHPMRHIYMPVN